MTDSKRQTIAAAIIIGFVSLMAGYFIAGVSMTDPMNCKIIVVENKR